MSGRGEGRHHGSGRPQNAKFRQGKFRQDQHKVDEARLAAFDALTAVTMDGAFANLAIAEVLAERGLSGRDAAFATELLYGTCRGIGTYDWIIENAAQRALDTLEAGVIDVLRMCCHQLLSMRVPHHAAVDSSVNLTRMVNGKHTTGVVNAVAHKIARLNRQEWFEFLGQDLPERARLVLETMHPGWIVDAYAQALQVEVGDEQLRQALLANNHSAQTTLVVRPGLCHRKDLPGKPTSMSPFGTVISGQPGSVEQVRNGLAGVQDEGSQLVALALARAKAASGLWLDMCAGPGGKAALLSGLALQVGTSLVASEFSAHRAKLVKQAVKRYDGLPRVMVCDGTRPAWPRKHFGKVMADVPCTGLGSLRRRPESRWRHQKSDLGQLVPLQRKLLATALDSAKSGGVVAYVTCSPHPAETEEVIAAVLAQRDDVTVLDGPALLPEVSDCGRGEQGKFVQLWPHKHGTDAMFCALLQVH